MSDIVESASNASVLPDLSHPNCALLVNASADWTADTGASKHMTPHRHWFSSYEPHSVPVELADGNIVMSAGIGSVKFKPDLKGAIILEFHKVLHVPKLRSNLLSVLYLTKHKNFTVSIIGSTLSFKLGNQLLFTASVNSNNVAYLNGITIPMTQYANLSSTCSLDLTLWHRRFSHLNERDLRKLAKGDLVNGLSLNVANQPLDPICEPCLAGKQHRVINKVATHRYTNPLELIHSDLHGPLPVQSREGFHYWMSFVDDASRYTVIALLKKKSDAFEAFQNYKALTENLLNRKIKRFRDDKGGEYMSKEFNDFMAKHGIERQHTVRNSPHQNGVAERMNETLAEGVTAILKESDLPASFWSHAVLSMMHTRNYSPTRALKDEVPFIKFFGQKPDVSYLRVFGCTAYVHVQKDQRTGIGSHTQKCVFIGYPPDYKAWIFYNPLTKKTLISKDVVFDERHMPGLKKPPPSAPPVQDTRPWFPNLVDIPDQVGVQDVPNQMGDEQYNALPPPQQPDPDPNPDSDSESSPSPPPQPPLRRILPARNRRPPGEWWIVKPRTAYHEPTPLIESSDDEPEPPTPSVSSPIDALAQAASAMNEKIVLDVQDAFEFAYRVTANHDAPRTLREALNTPQAEQWYDAAYQEIKALVDNGTWKLAKLPPGRKPIGSRWVFLVKRKKDGTIERYKGRVVAKGYAQQPGLDFKETFAPTAKWATIRAILALAAIEDMELESVDISSAFLNGVLEEEVYMEQPEGFHQGARDDFLLLLKGLYGLKQAPNIWHKKLNSVLLTLNFKQVLCEHSVWVYEKDDVKVIVPVFVDDMTIASHSKNAILQLKSDLKKHFKIHDLGPTTYLLGVGVDRDRTKQTLTISQRQYILDILTEYKMSDCNPVGTPMMPGLHLSKDNCPKTDAEKKEMKSLSYINAVGSLMYLAVATRPDIAFTVGVLARFSTNPGKTHWNAVKHLMRYLKGTLDLGITYGGNISKEMFLTYSDADHAGDVSTRKSTGSYLVTMGGGAISWRSKLQSIIALSTTEAEYISAVSAGQEILWLRNLLSELGYQCNGPSTLYIDNKSAIAVGKNPDHHGRMKHLDIRTYWLRQEVAKGTIKLEHIATNLMPADLLTKPLPKPKVLELRSMMGLS